jgi:hypothetical protein
MALDIKINQQIEALRDELNQRIDNGKLTVKASDFESPISDIFTNVINAYELNFTDATISGTNKIEIKGKTNLWGISDIFFYLLIVGNSENLDFTLSPETIPTQWKLSDGFPNAKDTYFDYLDTTNIQLIATSYKQSAGIPAFDLKKGINYYATCGITEALQSLKELNDEITELTLKGTIINEEGIYSFKIKSSITQTIELVATKSELLLLLDKQTEPTAKITASICKEDNSYPVIVTIPTTIDMLEQFYLTISDRLVDGKVTITKDDYGIETESDFVLAVFTDSLSLTETTIVNNNTEVVITGKTDIYGLTSQKIIITTVKTNNNRLDFTLESKLDITTWRLSDSFSQTKGSFMDNIHFIEAKFLAMTFEHELSENKYLLAKGLNYISIVKPDQALIALGTLGDQFSTFPLNGTILPVDTFYDIKLGYTTDFDIDLTMSGFQSVKLLMGAIVTIESKIIEDNTQNIAIITGTLQIGNFNFEGILQIPTEDSVSEWLFTLTTKPVELQNLTDILALSKEVDLNTYFPVSLTQLLDLIIKDTHMGFQNDLLPSAKLDTIVGFKDDEGVPKTWTVISSPELKVGNFLLKFIPSYQTYLDNGKNKLAFGFTTIVSGDVTMGGSAKVNVSLAIPLENDWTLKVTSDNTTLPSLTELARFGWNDSSATSDNYTNLLPMDWQGGPDFILDNITTVFNPFTPSLSSVGFGLSQSKDWNIIPDVLNISSWRIQMDLNIVKSYLLTGQLAGNAKISSVADIAVLIDLKEDETVFDIGLTENSIIKFPSFGELLKLTAGYNSDLPEGLSNFGASKIDQLKINFTPKNDKPINFFVFNMKGDGIWTIIENWLTLSDIAGNFTLNQNAGKYETKGYLNAIATVYNIPIWLWAGKEDYTSPWLFKLATKQDIHIPGLKDLAKWMLNEDMENYIPEAFMPFGKGFDVTKLNIDFDLTDNNLKLIEFAIKNSEPWEAISNYITFDDTNISAKISNLSKENQGLTSEIKTSVLIGKGGGGLAFTAQKTTEEGDWEFTGDLINTIEFSLSDLLDKINLSNFLVIPNESWLPTVTLAALKANMTPQQAIYNVEGKATIEWTIPFVDIKFPMKSLGGIVNIKHKKEEGEKSEDTNKANWFKAVIYGNFEFATINTTLGLQLGKKEANNIFTAELTNTEVAQMEIQTIANSLSSGEETTQWSTITPNDMTSLGFKSAYLYYNQTKGDYFIYGGISNFGDTIFYSKNIGTEDKLVKGYIFAFALAEGFKFSNLFSALAPIDNILNIENASIAITSYEVASATELVTEINQIVTIQDKSSSITNPIQQGNLPAGLVNKGVHLYSKLNFTGSLFTIFNQLISTGTDGLNVTLYAFFTTDSEPDEGSVKTIFQATFDAFDLINGLINFKGIDNAPGIMMKYIRADSSEFSLDGIIGFNVFGENYDFIGRLTVNNDQTHFNVTTPPETSIKIQLFPDSMPPLMVLKQLGLDVIYYFQTAERTQKYLELNVTGKVELIETIFLSSNLYLLDAKPILAQITLEQNFSISQLIGNIVGNDQSWPTDFFDITFIADTPQQPSRIYYYDTSVDTTPSKVNIDGNNYNNGYNLESTIDLTFLFTIRIILEINIETNVGMKARVGLGDAIKIFILELASKNKASDGNKKYINGPTLNLNTKGKTSVFGFTTGFNFFQYPFGTADVTIGKKEFGSGKTETKIGAKLTADKAVPIFGDLSVDFTYCQSEGFVINDWPDFAQVYESVQKIIDIADEVSGIMKKTDPSLICGAIVDLVADTVYENRFTMSPSFSTEGNENDGYSLYFVLNGTFEVYVLDQQVANIDFPNTIQIPLPDSTSFDDLGGYIEDAIKGSAESFVRGLMNNGEQWANLVAILFTEQAAELAAQMLCEGLIDTVVAEAITVGAEAVLAAGGVVAGAVAIAAGIAAVGKTISSCFTAGTEVIMADGSKKLIENVKIGEELKGYNNTVNKVLGYDRPKLGNRKLYAINDGPFFFTSEHPLLTEEGWKAIDPAKTKLENALLEVDKLTIGDTLVMNDGSTFRIDEIQETQAYRDTQLYNFNLSGNNTYIANSFIVHNKGEKPPKDKKPNPPKIKSLEYNTEKCEITTKWANAEYASGYNYQLVKPNGSKLDQKSLCFSENSVTTSIIGEDLPSGKVEAKVCSTRGDYCSKWNEKSIQKLAFTKDILLSYDESNELLQVNWDSIKAPAGYLIYLYNGSDEIIQNKTDKNVYSIDCNTLPEGIISAKVGAAGNSHNIPGDLVKSTNTIEKSTSPVNVIISIDNQKIKITWDNATNTNGFEIILLKDNQALNTTQTTDNQIEFDTSTFEAGVYSSKVRKQGSATELPSNYSTAKGSILKLGIPTNINFTYNTNTESLDVNWENVDQNNGYNLQIVNDNDKTQIAWEGSVATDIVTKSISVSDLLSNYSDYRVCIKALGSDDVLDSQYSSSVNEVIQIEAPTSTSIGYDKQMQIIKCTWSNVNDATSYHIQIENKQLESVPIVYQSNENKNITDKEIRLSEITDFSAGTYYLLVQAQGSQDIIPSKFTESDGNVIKLSEVNPSAVFEDNFIKVSWDLKENASSYQIKLSNADNSKTYEYLATNTPYEINASAYPKEEFTLTMQAKSDNNNVIDSDIGTGIRLTVNPLDINSLAKQLKGNGADVEQTSKIIHQAFPDVNFINFTIALASSGYTEQETVRGLKQEFPDLTPEELVEAINAAFKQQTPEEFAKQAKLEGESVCDAAIELMTNYPQLTATDFAVALAKGGYSQTDVVEALKQEFPNLTPSEFVNIINTAFN